MMHPPPLFAAPFSALLVVLLSLTSSRGAEKVSFNRDIRPILSDKCFTCHGPDADKRKGGLRLDVREAALKGGKSEIPSLVPGKPEASEVLTRVLSDDADEHMPPKKGGKVLKPEEIAVLRQWIQQGAEYQGHWALTKPERVLPPPAQGSLPAPGGNPVDAFIAARLAKDGLKPAPEADRPTLLRRVSLDLTGLPPTLPEIDAFLADRSPNAYEKVVDRLLASPRYGERMATQWLDFARYADSNGFQSDTSRFMSMWRDWVIQAFNENKPFDQFTIEQLAGDLLPTPTDAQIVATGFNRNHRLNGEGGRIVEEWFAETVIDRVETTGSTWLALTVGCARCHDHKFDPISQKEFYQIFAIFNSVDESGVLGGNGSIGANTAPVLTVQTPEQRTKLAALNQQIAAANEVLKAAEAGDKSAQVKWEKAALTATADWTALVPSQLKSANGATLSQEPDGNVFSSGALPPTDSYTLTADVDLPSVTGLRLELLSDPRLPAQGPGRHANGNPVVSEFHVSIANKGDGSQHEVAFRNATADFSQKDYEVQKAVDGKLDTGWAIFPEVGRPHSAVFTLKEPLNLGRAGGSLTIHIDQNFGAGALVGKFRLSVTGAAEPSPAPAEIVQILKVAPDKRNDAQKKKLAEFHASRGGNVASAKAKVDELTKARTEVERSIPSTMVMKELAKPRDAHILVRGQYDNIGEKVERGLPAALPPLPPGAPMNRLGFAQWIVSGENPLTARVWVNRAWERFFGVGLVKSSENFGSQADWPSHPELLDWLACEFVQPTVTRTVSGQPVKRWDMKALQKLIVTSATYRQSAQVTPALLEKDPANRLVARGPRFRLGAEMLRDSALAVSGLLVEKLGGPSVKPYMPKGIWDETSVYGDMRNYKSDPGEGLYRRTLYTVWKRTAAPSTNLLFDSPNREICSVKRSSTNTPLQALALLNEVTYVEAARKLAERMITEGGKTPEERIQWGFRKVTSRLPDERERQILSRGLEAQLARFEQDPAAAAKLLTFGESKSPAAIPAAQLAAYTLTANVLFNLDEFIVR